MMTDNEKRGQKKASPEKSRDRGARIENPRGFAIEDEPTWAPPEHQPEPRPTEPILNDPTSPKQGSQTNSPA
jgi:hypothetical protein